MLKVQAHQDQKGSGRDQSMNNAKAGFKPLIEHRADPYVCRHSDGWYYFTASVPDYDRIELRKSRTIQGLAAARPVAVWRKRDSGPMSAHVWAPELHHLDGRWYLYFAAGEKEDPWKIRPYVLMCDGQDPLADEWVELGMLQPADGDFFSFSDFSLDATIFEHDGRRYCIWAQKVREQGGVSNLYIAEMASPIRLKTKPVLLSTPEYRWERIGFVVNEGPAVLKRNGNLYVFYSASSTGACYCVGLLTASEDANPLDPGAWTKRPLPVLSTDRDQGIYGPGHNSFTVSENGEDLIVFHARPSETIAGDPLYDPSRHTLVAKLTWNADGTPRFLPLTS